MLHFTEYRNHINAPWVTFIHGAGGSSSIWYKQIRSFQEEFNVLLIDLRGHGQSQNSNLPSLKRYTFSAIGDDVIEVLDHFDISKTHFIGISMGTIIIRELADRYQERVQTLIMGGAVMRLNAQGRILMYLGNSLKSVIPFMVLYKIFAWIILPRENHRKSRVLFIREARRMYHKEFKRWFGLAVQINPLLKFFRNSAPCVPTLYIMGEQDYMFLPAVRKLVKFHTSSELRIIPACGHVVNIERPLDFNQICLSFLGK